MFCKPWLPFDLVPEGIKITHCHCALTDACHSVRSEKWAPASLELWIPCGDQLYCPSATTLAGTAAQVWMCVSEKLEMVGCDQACPTSGCHNANCGHPMLFPPHTAASSQ